MSISYSIGIYLFFMDLLCLAEFTVPSNLNYFPNLAAEMHPHSMMLPLLCLAKGWYLPFD